MTDEQPHPGPSAEEPGVGEANIARLLREAYAPQPPNAEFAARVHRRVLAVAREATRGRGGAVCIGASVPAWRWVAAAAVLLVAVILYTTLDGWRRSGLSIVRHDGPVVWIDGKPYRPADLAAGHVPGSGVGETVNPDTAPVIPVLAR